MQNLSSDEVAQRAKSICDGDRGTHLNFNSVTGDFEESGDGDDQYFSTGYY